MKPYRIISTILITQSGNRIPIDYKNDEICTHPLKEVKKTIINAFSMMYDKVVDVEFKIEMV